MYSLNKWIILIKTDMVYILIFQYHNLPAWEMSGLHNCKETLKSILIHSCLCGSSSSEHVSSDHLYPGLWQRTSSTGVPFFTYLVLVLMASINNSSFIQPPNRSVPFPNFSFLVSITLVSTRSFWHLVPADLSEPC